MLPLSTVSLNNLLCLILSLTNPQNNRRQPLEWADPLSIFHRAKSGLAIFGTRNE
jgi:hypothetical protein